MKKYLFLLATASTLSVLGQNYNEKGEELLVKCHTTQMQEALFLQNPDLKQQAEFYEAQLEEFTKNFAKENIQKDGDIFIIPVVFHIVHNYGDENISAAQIEDAIRVMNEDFSAQNSDVNSVNPAFQDIVANVGVEFRLAQIDPQGNCTNGIVRTVSTLTNSGGENLKQISPIWNRSKYMNVWVCKTIESGAAGYTYYPSALSGPFGQTNDGIVVRSDYVGAIGTSSSGISHTLTHEVGHWINLPHLWGDSNDPGLASNCNIDDGVADTPNTIGWSSCNINGQSCGSLDNVENYMEYAFCSKMFTEGQKTRMIAALNSNVASRNNLWQNQNLISTGVLNEAALCAAEFSANERVICIGGEITFSDLSFNNVESRDWTFEGGSPESSTEDTPIVTYTIPGLYAVTLAASDGENIETELKTDYIRVMDTSVVASPFVEGFEDIPAFNESFEDFWFTDNQTGNIDWEVTDQAAYSGSYSAYVRGRYNQNQASEMLLSKPIDLSGIDSLAILTFKYAHARRNSNSDDVLRVWISRNCGELWSLRRTISGSSLPTVEGNVTQEFFPTSQDQWEEVTVSTIVPAFLNAQFRVRFEFISENGNNIFIDDINIFNAASPTSVETPSVIERTLLIYPNPASDQVFVSLTNARTSNTTITLLDISGREVKSVHAGTLAIGDHQFELNTNLLPAGVYIFRIQSDRDGLISRKLVIQ